MFNPLKSKPLLIIAGVLVVVAGLALGINSYVHAKVAVALAEQKVKDLEAQVSALDGQIDDFKTENAKTEAALAASQQARIEREKEFQKQLSTIQHATPQQLVDQGSEIVGATDISTDGKVVTMPVETWRKVVFRLAEWKEYKEVREPAWNAREALYQKDISDWKANSIIRDQKDALNTNIITGLKDVISHQKTMSTLQKVAWFGAGVGLGMLGQKVIK